MRPLESITIIDLTVNTPGPFCSMTLGDLGARVIKVEPPGGDPLRRSSAPMFAALNRGKESVSLDLKSAFGRAALHRLAEKGDIVLEGWRPGVAARLGADYATLSGVNPALVYCSISGFGQEGPWRDRPAHDVNYLAIGGYMGMQASIEGRPWPPAILISDVAAGMYAAIAALAAIVGRSATGRGAAIDLAMADAVLSLLGIEDVEALSPQDGDRKPNVAGLPTYGLFCCEDGRWISLGIVDEDHFWRRFCEAAGLRDMAEWTLERRMERAEHVAARLADAFRRRPAGDWERRLMDVDVPAAVAVDLDEALRSPHFEARRTVVGVGRHRFVAQPMRFSTGSVSPRRAPPALDANRDAILAELGYTP